jgi:hypothetical protein
MTPGCGDSLGSNSHHIRPLSAGGEDTEENLIVLCLKHHRAVGMHSQWEKWYVTLLTWKFFYESGGKCEEMNQSVPSVIDPLSRKTASISTAGPLVASDHTENPPIQISTVRLLRPNAASRMRQKPLVVCEGCGKEYQRNRDKQRFCMPKCQGETYRKLHPRQIHVSHRSVIYAIDQPKLIAALMRARVSIDRILKELGAP